MRGAVVAGDGLTKLGVDGGCELTFEVSWQFLGDADVESVLALAVDDSDVAECAGVAYLAAHLGVERGLLEHYLVERATLHGHLAVTEHAGLDGQFVIAYELGLLAFGEYGPVAEVLFVGAASHLFLVRECFLVLGLVGGEPVLAKDEFGQVKRESVGVLECEHVYAANLGLALFAGLVHEFGEQTDTFVQRAEERLFLAADDRRDLLFLLAEFGVGLAQVGDKLRHELVEERLALAEERVAVAHCAAQDAADDVAGFLIARELSVGDGESDGADMVSDDAHGDVGVLALTVFVSGQFADLGEHGLEDVGVVVRGLALDSAD